MRRDVASTMPRMQRTDPKDFTLVLTARDYSVSREIRVLSGRVSRSCDTLTDGWTASVPWTPGKDSALDTLLGPYSYALSQVYLGPRLVNTGYLYSVENDIQDSGVTKSLVGFASTADLVDSTVKPDDDNGCMWSDTSILDFAKQITAKFGIEAVATPEVMNDTYLEPFPMIQCQVTDKYGDVIAKLAFQRQMLATNDYLGNLLLWSAQTSGKPVGTLAEGDPRVTKWNIKFAGRDRFGTYIVYGQDSFGSQIQSESVDPVVPAYRVQGVTAGELGEGNVQTTAVFKRNQQLVQALTFPIPVTDWYAPDGSLWGPNTLVRIVSPSMHIPKGFTFLVRQSVHVFEANKRTTDLSLIPPDIYSSSPLQEPWR